MAESNEESDTTEDTAGIGQQSRKEPSTPAVDPSEVEILPFHADAITNVRPDKGRIVEQALRKGRRHFGRPGASLTQLDDPRWKGRLPEGWDRGVLSKALEGEETTSAMILSWMRDKPAVVLIDSVHIKGAGKEELDPETGLIESGDTDHILIVGHHIFVIDSKRWRGGKTDDKPVNYIQADDGSVQRFGRDFPGGHVHIGAAIHMWFDYLQTWDNNKTILGMVHIVNDNVKVLRYKNWYTVRNRQYWILVEKGRLIEELDAWYSGTGGGGGVSDEERRTVSTDLVSQVAICCCRPYSRMDAIINTRPLQGYAV